MRATWPKRWTRTLKTLPRHGLDSRIGPRFLRAGLATEEAASERCGCISLGGAAEGIDFQLRRKFEDQRNAEDISSTRSFLRFGRFGQAVRRWLHSKGHGRHSRLSAIEIIKKLLEVGIVTLTIRRG